MTVGPAGVKLSKHVQERRGAQKAFDEWCEESKFERFDVKLLRKVTLEFFTRPWDGICYQHPPAPSTAIAKSPLKSLEVDSSRSKTVTHTQQTGAQQTKLIPERRKRMQPAEATTPQVRKQPAQQEAPPAASRSSNSSITSPAIVPTVDSVAQWVSLPKVPLEINIEAKRAPTTMWDADATETSCELVSVTNLMLKLADFRSDSSLTTTSIRLKHQLTDGSVALLLSVSNRSLGRGFKTVCESAKLCEDSITTAQVIFEMAESRQFVALSTYSIKDKDKLAHWIESSTSLSIPMSSPTAARLYIIDLATSEVVVDGFALLPSTSLLPVGAMVLNHNSTDFSVSRAAIIGIHFLDSKITIVKVITEQQDQGERLSCQMIRTICYDAELPGIRGLSPLPDLKFIYRSNPSFQEMAVLLCSESNGCNLGYSTHADEASSWRWCTLPTARIVGGMFEDRFEEEWKLDIHGLCALGDAAALFGLQQSYIKILGKLADCMWKEVVETNGGARSVGDFQSLFAESFLGALLTMESDRFPPEASSPQQQKFENGDAEMNSIPRRASSGYRRLSCQSEEPTRPMWNGRLRESMGLSSANVLRWIWAERISSSQAQVQLCSDLANLLESLSDRDPPAEKLQADMDAVAKNANITIENEGLVVSSKAGGFKGLQHGLFLTTLSLIMQILANNFVRRKNILRNSYETQT